MGSARLGIMVAERFRRKRKMTRTTRTSATSSVIWTSWMDSLMDGGPVVHDVQAHGCRDQGLIAREDIFDGLYYRYRVGARLALDGKDYCPFVVEP